MKVISKIILSSVLTVVLVPSANAFAIQDTRTDSSQIKMKVESKACEQIGVTASKLQGTLNTKKQSATDKRVDKQASLAEKQQKLSTDLALQRQQWDAKRAENFARLRAAAQTDEQKAAVETYITTVTNAINTRRAAHDAAIATFRADMNALLTKQRGQGDGAAATLKIQIDQAVAKARSSCQAGTSVKEALTTLKADIKTAQDTYKQSRKTADIKPQIKALTQTKKDALKAATDTFLQTTEQARKDLKSAFGSSDSNLEN